MEIKIRKAEPRDVPRMLALVKELATFEKEPDAVTVPEADMLDAGFGARPVWWGWVACGPGDEVLGTAICYERYSTWRGRVGYLEDIVVTESARSLRIGEKLFKACAAEAVRRKYHHLTWQVLDWNEGAIRFYKRLGAELDPQWVNGRMDAEQLKTLAEG